MLCPKDNIVCDLVQLQDVSIDVCPRCLGVWLEQGEVRRLVRHLSIPEYSDVPRLLAEWDIFEHQGTPPKDFWREDTLVCTKDGAPMRKHYFAGTQIGIDQCQKCHRFWLDGGELHAIAAYVKPDHDLDRAWQSFIRDENEWRRKLQEAKTLPAQLLLMATNPKTLLVILASFVTRIVLDRLQEPDKTVEKR